MAVYEITVSQMLPMTQGLGSNPYGLAVAQTLALVETVKIMPLSISVVQTLNLGQLAECHQSIRNITVTQGLELWHSGARSAASEVFTQFLHMWQEAKVVEYEQVVQTLVLTQLVVVVKSRGISNTLSLAQSVTYNLVRSITVEDFLTLNHGATGYLLDEDTYSTEIPEFGGPNAPEC